MENKDDATTEENNNGTTHWENCFADGPKHWVCAMRKIGELEGALRGSTMYIEIMLSKLAGYGERDEAEH